MNRPYTVTYQVTWSGEPSDYAILPPQLVPVDWASVSVESAEAFVQDGKNVVRQRLTIIPRKSGEHRLPEVRIAYLAPNTIQEPPKTPGSPATDPAPSDPPSLRADPSQVLVSPDRTLAWLFGGLFFVCTTLVVAILVRHWGKRRVVLPGQQSPAPDLSAAQADLQRAKKHRLDGRFYEYYAELTRAAEKLLPQHAEVLTGLKARTQDVGYRGIRPTDSEMDSDYREIERVLNRFMEESAT